METRLRDRIKVIEANDDKQLEYIVNTYVRNHNLKIKGITKISRRKYILIYTMRESV